ncbi:MAG: PQQ-dependent sugar dehydrogenase [Planctomycetes bacterium]|nr:PQQ-dependent sugar dehydrogenase [Planctomycetota bacterium]
MIRPFLTALCLAVGLLVGCGDQPKPVVKGSEQDQSSTTPTVAGHAATPVAEAKDDSPLRVRFDLLLRDNLPSVAVEVVPLPDGKSFFVLGRNGAIHLYDRPVESLTVGDGKGVQPKAKLSFDNVYAKGDLGSLALALDPDWNDNHFLYVWCSDSKDENVYLDRFQWQDDLGKTSASRTTIIKFSRSQPEGPYHMGGILQFLADKSLLIMTGDAEHPHISQDQKNLNGKILRIMPGRGPEGGYTVPADNPHVGDEAWAPEIVALGLRAPFRGSLHGARDFFIADVGAVHEEINYWTMDPTKPVNFGWGLGEIGKAPQPLSDGPLGIEGVIDPIISWTREQDFSGDDQDYAGETRMSAGVGPVYGAAAQDRYAGKLGGKLIFFDIMRGWFRAAVLDGDHKVASHAHIGHMAFLAHVFEGRDGYLYGLTWGPTPSLYRVVSEKEMAAR